MILSKEERRAILFIALIFVPFMDKKANLGISSRPFTVIGWVLVAYIVLLTLLGYMV